MGPPELSTPTSTRNAMQLLSTVTEPTRLLITASFPQDFCLSTGSARNVALRLTAKGLNNSAHFLFLSSFQLLLFAYTDIRAGSASSGQMSCWTIQSLSNLNLRLALGDEEGECDIDPTLWCDKRVPETAVPNFDACNISRRYEAEILLGLQCRHAGKAGRVSVVQLRVPVRIGSGLMPGRKLEDLETMEIRLGLQRESVVGQVSSMEEFGEKEAFPAPPTYEEATQRPEER
ncbi:uncharacterized protein N0V89_002579 [Didymosphaeria variabile]|uniref:Uncharacterized protein n=1 Tax=Didymosphaeria variabile TaxID=1932322 RepID=A0A9W8XST4_9PLEO|nr:uncharacterized protein N0V89_002579 [Didymosphaeria variabile]KAJ4358001.1 hypothetical protein N0V89_002579 [Didymosphaeria variabile]